MKKIMFLFVMLLSTIATFSNVKSESLLNDIVIEQTITFKNSDEKIIIWYVKRDKVYQVYSNTDLTKQSPKKLKNAKDTTIRIASSYYGKCFLTCNSLNEVCRIAADLYQKYGNYVEIEDIKIVKPFLIF